MWWYQEVGISGGGGAGGWWGHEHWALMNGISVFIRRDLWELTCSLSILLHVRIPGEDISKPGREFLSDTGPASALILGFLVAGTVRNKYLSSNSPGLWYFVIAAWFKIDMNIWTWFNLWTVKQTYFEIFVDWHIFLISNTERFLVPVSPFYPVSLKVSSGKTAV